MAQNGFCGRLPGRSALWRAGLGTALAAVVVCANVAAARAGDDDDQESLTSKFMKTLGLKDPTVMEDGINYSERSPLVVPPTRNLPAPVTTGAVPVPNWPKDPDVRKRAIAKAKAKEVHPATPFQDSLPLRPDELEKGVGANRADGQMASADGSDEQRQSSVRDLAGKKAWYDPRGWFKKEEYATFTGEPTRANLTDPPPGYQTPSPDQPYGVGQLNQKNKVKGLAERMEDSSGH
jgi:hypothetical protein